MIGIYMIRNLINEKIYIGQSRDIYKRWKQHKSDLNCNRHINEHLQSAWNKYGEENFEFSVLCECEENQLNTLEQYYIFELFSYDDRVGYNKNYGGKNGRHTEESKRRQSKALKGKYCGKKCYWYGKHHSEESRKKISEVIKGKNNPMYGKHHTKETKEKMSNTKKGKNNPMYGKHLSEEHKMRLSEATKGKNNPMYGKNGKNHPNYKGYICIFPNGVISKVMIIKEMGEFLDVSEAFIVKLAKSKEPYKFSNKARGNREHLKTLEGIRILYYEDYLQELEQAS